jgi:hypothetical protein
MQYHVVGGSLKDEEFQKYIGVLVELGVPTKRDASGSVGIVTGLVLAQQIHAVLSSRLPYLQWMIIQIPDPPAPSSANDTPFES